jgi:hypothetical protein
LLSEGHERSFLFAVGNRPCDLEGNVDCSAKQREQQHDLFKRYEAFPLSAFASGEAKSFSSPLARSRKELDHRLCNQRLFTAEAALTAYHKTRIFATKTPGSAPVRAAGSSAFSARPFYTPMSTCTKQCPEVWQAFFAKF